MLTYDIVIIGAGPSGATLARLLDKKYKILIVDKRNLEDVDNFTKPVCCGGLLAPDAQNALSHLGLGVPKDVLVGPQMFSVKTIDNDNALERYYQRHYINVDREKFDRWLAGLMPIHVEKSFCTFYYKHKKTAEGYEVVLKKMGKKVTVKTKLLVGADGALSRVREQVFKGLPMPDKYVSMQYWYKTNATMPHFYSIFDQRVTDFYSWVIQKGNDVVLGTGLNGSKDAYKRMEILVEDMKKKGIITGQLQRKEGTLIMRTRKLKHIHLHKEGVALIGEAAGFISPSSAEGISYGIRSGQYLAKAINTCGNAFNDDYVKRCFKLKLNLLLKNIKLHAMYHPFLRKLIMKSRILSMDIYSEK